MLFLFICSVHGAPWRSHLSHTYDEDCGFAAMAGNDRQNPRRGMGAKPGAMGTWKCQTQGCGEGIMERTQQRIEYARKQQGITGMPKDIICSECYGKLLDGTSMKLKDGSVPRVDCISVKWLAWKGATSIIWNCIYVITNEVYYHATLYTWRNLL